MLQQFYLGKWEQSKQAVKGSNAYIAIEYVHMYIYAQRGTECMLTFWGSLDPLTILMTHATLSIQYSTGLN